ncbi:MAG: NFACT RNA binding domain-containing protein, partial [Chloroflexota bacterium]
SLAASFSKAIEAHFSRSPSGETDGYQAARFPIYLAIEQAQKRLARRLKALEKDAAKLEDPTVYREKGEAILAMSYQIKPRQSSLTVDWTGTDPLQIHLDPKLSASENAQRYFSRYQKAKRAADIIPEQQTSVQLELDYLNQLALDLDMAEARPDIDAVAAALVKAGFSKSFKKQTQKTIQKKTTPAASQPRRFISPDGFVILVGRNAEQNHRLTFGQAKPDDIWLHARGMPGSHVVISAPDTNPPKSTIEWAAGIAAYYSKAKKAGRAIVSYTRKKYVRPIKGAPPGMVRISNESTVRVAPFTPNES